MHPSLRVLSSRAHQPLIKFLGKRTFPNTPSVPHAHPAAPAEIKSQFSQFLKKIEASVKTSTPASTALLKDFWEAPERLWKQDIEEAEIEAIMVSFWVFHRRLSSLMMSLELPDRRRVLALIGSTYNCSSYYYRIPKPQFCVKKRVEDQTVY
ncbi:hypothetical protein J132_08646 [Termitomyces sp. J132]|nr:hypothetical protein J132_08646 [Termitomyces sp. J132]